MARINMIDDKPIRDGGGDLFQRAVGGASNNFPPVRIWGEGGSDAASSPATGRV